MFVDSGELVFDADVAGLLVGGLLVLEVVEVDLAAFFDSGVFVEPAPWGQGFL